MYEGPVTSSATTSSVAGACARWSTWAEGLLDAGGATPMLTDQPPHALATTPGRVLRQKTLLATMINIVIIGQPSSSNEVRPIEESCPASCTGGWSWMPRRGLHDRRGHTTLQGMPAPCSRARQSRKAWRRMIDPSPRIVVHCAIRSRVCQACEAWRRTRSSSPRSIFRRSSTQAACSQRSTQASQPHNTLPGAMAGGRGETDAAMTGATAADAAMTGATGSMRPSRRRHTHTADDSYQGDPLIPTMVPRVEIPRIWSVSVG